MAKNVAIMSLWICNKQVAASYITYDAIGIANQINMDKQKSF